MKQIVCRFCEGVLNYKSKRPESHPTKECAFVCVRTKLLLLSHNFSNVMINNTSTNEAHWDNGKQTQTIRGFYMSGTQMELAMGTVNEKVVSLNNFVLHSKAIISGQMNSCADV
jgi:hypothetical protein